MFSCTKNTRKKNSSVRRTKQNRLTLAQNFSVCDKKKSMFVQYLEARGFFSKLGIKTSLSNIPLIGDISF